MMPGFNDADNWCDAIDKAIELTAQKTRADKLQAENTALKRVAAAANLLVRIENPNAEEFDTAYLGVVSALYALDTEPETLTKRFSEEGDL